MEQKPKSKRATRFSNSKTEAMSKRVDLTPMNDNQALYLASLKGPTPITVVVGPAGTGKTYMATVEAANRYLDKESTKIILTRPNVAAGKDLGYLPGTINEKYEPWLVPILETLTEVMGKGMVETAVKNGNVEFAPLTYMRGRSLQNAFVICDESQNLTIPEMVLLTTRIGDNTKVVINGDVMQKDIKDKSGLSMLIDIAKKYEIDLDLIEFGFDDIVRSKLCKDFVVAYMKEKLL
jgi:phosphate starvation-inducible PhoH-like protein